MNATEVKNSVLSYLNNILEMSIEEVEKYSGETIEELIKTPWNWKQKKIELSDVFNYVSKCLPESWELKHEQLEIAFPGTMVETVCKMVKSGFPNGKNPEHKNKTKKQDDFSGLELQKKIERYRTAYNDGVCHYSQYSSYRTFDCHITGEEVEKMYKKAKPNDLIRLCWKYITNPENLEGVHFAWENPKVKFEPVGSYEVPEYMRTKTCVA